MRGSRVYETKLPGGEGRRIKEKKEERVGKPLDPVKTYTNHGGVSKTGGKGP